MTIAVLSFKHAACMVSSKHEADKNLALTSSCASRADSDAGRRGLLLAVLLRDRVEHVSNVCVEKVVARGETARVAIPGTEAEKERGEEEKRQQTSEKAHARTCVDAARDCRLLCPLTPAHHLAASTSSAVP